MQNFSRRGFAGLVLASLFRPLRVNGQSTGATGSKAPAPVKGETGPGFRAYRADASILFMGCSLYRRAGVGGGEASVEQTGEGASLRRSLFFGGGSDPKHSHGFSRLGWMREVVSGPSPTPVEAAYFGVLTSTPDESLERARKAAGSPTSGQNVFSAVSGRNTVGRSRSAVTHFEFPAGIPWSDRSLIDHAHSTFDANVDWRETSWPNSHLQAPPTFLSQLANLLGQRVRRATGRYVYSEQEYSLELERRPADRDGLLPVHGKIRNLRTGRETPFDLWMESSDSILPTRIEFQPRSYLRLTFEAVPA